MSNTYYVLANFSGDSGGNTGPWMTSIPFYEYKDESSSNTNLSMIRDTIISFISNNGDVLKFTMYSIKANDLKDFARLRGDLFRSNNFSRVNLESIGFMKVVDFTYIVNEKNIEQQNDGFKIKFCYDRDEKMFKDKIYLSCPTVVF
jgi:hypothetical protein